MFSTVEMDVDGNALITVSCLNGAMHNSVSFKKDVLFK